MSKNIRPWKKQIKIPPQGNLRSQKKKPQRKALLAELERRAAEHRRARAETSESAPRV